MAFSTLPKKFEDIRQFLITTISQRYPTLGGFLQNSFLLIFVDLVAYAIELFMDFSSNLFNELHLPTATQFENARIKSEFYGYKAHRKLSASGTIRVGLTPDFDTSPAENIVFKKFDALLINGIDYVVAENTVFKTTDTEIQVPVLQGKLITVNNTALGNQDETFTIEDNSIENTVLIVEVDSVEYTQVDSFFKSTPTDLHYTVGGLLNLTGITITFGDGFRGIQITAGQSVDIMYIRTDSLEGQIKSVGFEVTFLESYELSDTTPVNFYGENDSQLVGADNIELLDSVKFFGQKATSSIDNKAFNDDEIKLELQEFGGILLSKAVSEYDNNPDNPDFTFANRVKLMVLLTSGLEPDNSKKGEIRNYLRPRMDFTDFIEFIDIDFINIRFVLDFEVFINAPQDFGPQVDTYLQQTYAVGNSDFGISINHSEVSQGIANEFDEFIRRFNLLMLVTESLVNPVIPTSGIINKTLLIGGLRGDTDPSIKSCKMTIDFDSTITGEGPQEILESNESGGFDVVGGGSSQVLDSSSIDFITGEIILDIKGTVTSIGNIKFDYETFDTGGVDLNVDIKFNQIIQYGESAGPDSESIKVEFVT